MRNAFVRAIHALAGRDPEVVLVTADIGNRLFDRFKADYPGRFFNCGVAEQNMTGVAAGLAMAGFRPFTYTIAPFVTTRCLEQIRVDLCYHRLNVVVTAVGAGYAYASLGATHHACEDLAFLRALPEMRVVCPGDAFEVEAAVAALGQIEGPAYLRLGKKGEPLVHAAIPELRLGQALVVRPGERVALLSTGNLLPEAVEAARLLEEGGVACEVVSFHTVKPLDEAYLRAAVERMELVVTLEEHRRLGGLGSAVAEWICALPRYPRARLVSLGTPDQYPHEAGEQDYFRALYGLQARFVAERIRRELCA